MQRITFLLKIMRLQYIAVVLIPFLFGYCIEYRNIGLGKPLSIVIGLCVIVCFYISAVLFNDSFAKRSGQDWHRARFFSFTDESSSKIGKDFSLRFCFILATVFAFLGVIGIFSLNLLFYADFTYVWVLIILFLTWAYQVVPPQFSFSAARGLFLFILFGPALVMFAYFIRTGILFSLRPLILSLPFGFLILTLLICREMLEHKMAGQRKEKNLVIQFEREKAFIIYFFIIVLILSSAVVIHQLGFMSEWIYLPSIFLIIGLSVTKILKRNYDNQDLLKRAFALSVAQYFLFALGMFTVVII